MPTYLYIPKIKGNVTSAQHKDWIEINELDFQLNRHINTMPGQVFDRESSQPSISEISLSKQMDNSSALLFQQACTAKAIPEIKIDLCQTNHTNNAYTQFTLSNVMVSSYHLANKKTLKEQRPIEIIKLSFDRIEFRYTPYNKNNEAQSPLSTGYDLKSASVI